jgi:hypothetical protein
MRKRTLAQMCRIARRRGGSCLSTRYVNALISLLWRCRLGHEWNASPVNVARGTWCPSCARERGLTLLEMQRLASDRGGKCLSAEWPPVPREDRSDAQEDHSCRHVQENLRSRDCETVRSSLDNPEESLTQEEIYVVERISIAKLERLPLDELTEDNVEGLKRNCCMPS